MAIGVNPNTVISNLLKKVGPSFQGLANSPNAKPLGGIFSSGVPAIEKGQTTQAIIQASQIRQSTPTIEQLYPTIKTNFATIQNVFSNLANIIPAAFQAPSSTAPVNQSPSGGQQGAADPSNTQPPSGSSSLSQDLRKSLDGIKNYVGPAGLLVGAGLLGLLIISRKR